MRRREELEDGAGIAPRRFQYMNQVHGNEVSLSLNLDRRELSPQAPTADAHGVPQAAAGGDGGGLHSAGSGGRTGLPAPCCGVVHAGRPGLFSGVIPAAVEQMRAAGAEDIRAWLGPSVCGQCYEVPAELRDEVAAVAAVRMVNHRLGDAGARPARRRRQPARIPGRAHRIPGALHP